MLARSEIEGLEINTVAGTLLPRLAIHTSVEVKEEI